MLCLDGYYLDLGLIDDHCFAVDMIFMTYLCRKPSQDSSNNSKRLGLCTQYIERAYILCYGPTHGYIYIYIHNIYYLFGC